MDHSEQDCSNSSATAVTPLQTQLLQSCTKPLKWLCLQQSRGIGAIRRKCNVYPEIMHTVPAFVPVDFTHILPWNLALGLTQFPQYQWDKQDECN